MGELFVPVSIESIHADAFPDVALYIRSGSTYILYRSHARKFSPVDAARLADSGVEFLFVSPAHLEDVTSFTEDGAERVLNDLSLAPRIKGKIIFQTSINFVGDLFQHPEKVGDLARGRRLVGNLLHYLASDRNALDALETVISPNRYPFFHSLQVAALSMLLHLKACALSPEEIVDVGMGTLLHDFGKAFIPQQILHKQGILSGEELEAYRRHPEEGFQYLRKNSRFSDLSLGIVRHHHERNSGIGYPQGLKGTQISLCAQVAALCDVYCNLTVDHSCRKALSPAAALWLMKQEMKGSFSDRLLDLLQGIVCVDDAAQSLQVNQ